MKLKFRIMNRKDALFIIEQTVKAPSGHNTQPWLFGIDENYIRIYPVVLLRIFFGLLKSGDIT